MKERSEWHSATIDGRNYDVKYLGQGWGRAVAPIRGVFPDVGKAVLKVTSSASDQNRLEIEVLKEVEAMEEAAANTMLQDVLPKTVEVVADGVPTSAP